MRAVLLGCLLAAVAGESFAHRLDEYLQATRIAVTTNRIDLSFELTAGVSVADRVLEVIDRDRDGHVSSDEGNAYAQQFLKDLSIGLDGKPVKVSVTSVSTPPLQEIRSGIGAIRIRTTSAVGPLSVGRHSLSLTNVHLPAMSVYLVNALVPKGDTIQITKQIRDELQKGYRLEFEVHPTPP